MASVYYVFTNQTPFTCYVGNDKKVLDQVQFLINGSPEKNIVALP